MIYTFHQTWPSFKISYSMKKFLLKKFGKPGDENEKVVKLSAILGREINLLGIFRNFSSRVPTIGKWQLEEVFV